METATRNRIPLHEDPSIKNGEENDPNESYFSTRRSVFSLTTSVIGGGILSLPFTMKIIGILPAIFLIIPIGFFAQLNINLLIRLSLLFKMASYGELVERAFGKKLRIIAESCIILNNFGVLVFYLIIIVDILVGSYSHVGVFQQFLNKNLVQALLDYSFLTLAAIITIVLAPLCMIPDIYKLRCASASSVILAIFLQVMIFSIAITKVFQGSVEFPRMYSDFVVLDSLIVFPIMTNAYGFHSDVHEIFSELKRPSVQRMSQIARNTTLLCTFSYVLTSVSCYLLFGENTDPNILKNFDKDIIGIWFSSVLNFIIRVGFIVHLILVFPTIHFSLRETVIATLFSGSGSGSRNMNQNILRSAYLFVIICVGAAIIRYFSLKISTVFDVLGSTTAVLLSFIIPSGIAVKLSWCHGGAGLSLRERLSSWFLLVTSTVVFVCGGVVKIYNFVYTRD